MALVKREKRKELPDRAGTPYPVADKSQEPRPRERVRSGAPGSSGLSLRSLHCGFQNVCIRVPLYRCGKKEHRNYCGASDIKVGGKVLGHEATLPLIAPRNTYAHRAVSWPRPRRLPKGKQAVRPYKGRWPMTLRTPDIESPGALRVRAGQQRTRAQRGYTVPARAVGAVSGCCAAVCAQAVPPITFDRTPDVHL